MLNSGLHGRLRRQERNIQKIDLQRARRYGMKEPARDGRVKYTYGGVVFIYDPQQNREVTSYKAPDAAPTSSGTKNSQPIILRKDEQYENNTILAFRALTRDMLLKNKRSWTSHSVLVVDMSGSMRRDDVNGARCRSDGVWMTLARDFVKRPLKNKSRSNTDLISVVLMRDEAEVVLKYELTDWVLYNKFIDLRNWTEERPAGPGNYMPALDAAEKLLMKNQTSNCSLSLMFFSDGKPSDRGEFSKKMGNIAAKFGRRLSVACIGMADKGEDFSTLNDMVDEATSFGAVATFGKPSLDADSLSNIITGLASSLTASKTEMTNLATGKVRKVRMDITRERKNTPDDLFVTADWNCYNTESKFVNRIWSWSTQLNDFVQVIDSRCGVCWKHTDRIDSLCPYCYAYCFCANCTNLQTMKHHRSSRACSKLIAMKKSGKLVSKEVPSFSVAMKDQIFGEGAERIVRKCRFLDQHESFTGPVMVAKESRFVDDSHNHDFYEKRMEYHREFMRTQGMAAEMAKEFNGALENVSVHFVQPLLIKSYVRKIPKIKFLEPFVVETLSAQGEYNVLVEPMLEGQYEKFNDNMGMVRGQNESGSIEDLSGEMGNLGIGNDPSSGGLGLDIIAEGSEDEDDSDDEIIEEKKNALEQGSYTFDRINDAHIPQAFSHFSFEKSKRYFMVVDLQGVLKTNADGTKCYELTDPVIHKRRKKKKKKLQQYTFGRTVSSSYPLNSQCIYDNFLILIMMC